MKMNRLILDTRICRAKGFSVTELIVVIALAAILMAMSLPYYSDWRKTRYLRATASEISNFMREARSYAISKGVRHRVVFDPINKTYQLQEFNIATSSYNAPTNVLTAPTEVTIRSSADGTSTATLSVEFNPNGTATITGPEAPMNGNVSINQGATQVYWVNVLQTGRISMLKK
jgi:type IV fimbrial biogenesis protein FimT